jgi:hypothetical protein
MPALYPRRRRLRRNELCMRIFLTLISSTFKVPHTPYITLCYKVLVINTYMESIEGIEESAGRGHIVSPPTEKVRVIGDW